MKALKYILAFVCAFIVGSCGPDEVVFDHPFIYIENDAGAKESRIADNVSDEKSYYVFMSTKAIDRDVKIDFEIIAGDGLVEGVDYEFPPTFSNPLIITPGLYRAPIRIIWKKNKIDTSKDNTLRIVLTGNSENFILGFPGPDQNNRQHVITRFAGVWN